MLAGHLASPTCTAATWKVVEKHLQDLPLSWFEDISPDECNAENCSPNAQPAAAASAGTCKAVMLVSPAPQDFRQLSDFLRVSQGKCCLNSNIISGSSRSTLAGQNCQVVVLYLASVCRSGSEQHLAEHGPCRSHSYLGRQSIIDHCKQVSKKQHQVALELTRYSNRIQPLAL